MIARRHDIVAVAVASLRLSCILGDVVKIERVSKRSGAATDTGNLASLAGGNSVDG